MNGRFGKSERPAIVNKQKILVPGPGQYEAQKTVSQYESELSLAKCNFGKRYHGEDRRLCPSPSKYYP